MLLAASVHQWYDLTWVDWTTVIGLPLTLLGLFLTWRQAWAAARTSRAVSRAVADTEMQIRVNQLMVLAPQLSWTVAELDAAIKSDNHDLAQSNLNGWRWQASRVHGILSSADPAEKKIAKSLNQAVALAQTAGAALLDAQGSVASHCLQARAAIVAVSDDLTTWISAHSTKVLSKGSEK